MWTSFKHSDIFKHNLSIVTHVKHKLGMLKHCENT